MVTLSVALFVQDTLLSAVAVDGARSGRSACRLTNPPASIITRGGDMTRRGVFGDIGGGGKAGQQEIWTSGVELALGGTTTVPQAGVLLRAEACAALMERKC